MKIGYVGLGAMGAALARRLMLRREMHVYDAQTELTRELSLEGAIGMEDLPSLAKECDVIMICLPTTAIVREAIFGKKGLAEGLSPGKIVIDQTTGDPLQTRVIAADLQQMGVRMMDAPVSGGPRGAVAGTIAIMCGGAADLFEIVRPLLEDISPNHEYCGDIGNGQVAKLVNNAVATCNRFITYETASVGIKNGLSLKDMAAVFNEGIGRNGASERLLSILGTDAKVSNFQLGLMAKDMGLAAQLGSGVGTPMLLANIARTLIEGSVNKLGSTRNMDDIPEVVEWFSGLKFADGRAEV